MPLTPTDLVLAEISPAIEIHDQIISVMEAHFGDLELSVEVDDYMEDFSPDAIKDLSSRAQRATLVLFDIPRIVPILNDDLRQSHGRIGTDEYTFGFYICSSSMRDDQGVERKLEAMKVLSRVQKVMSSQRLTITVDRHGGTKTVHPRPLEIDKLQNIPYLAVYQVMYTIKIVRDLSLSGFSA